MELKYGNISKLKKSFYYTEAPLGPLAFNTLIAFYCAVLCSSR